MTDQQRDEAAPAVAKILGFAGLLPFIAGSLYLLAGPLTLAQVAANALIGYGAVILSFMGAVHWGLALAGRSPEFRFGVSVVPALAGWGALLIALLGEHLLALTLLAAGFIGVYWLDLGAVRDGQAPAWYRGLRLKLTAVVVLSLGIAGATFF